MRPRSHGGAGCLIVLGAVAALGLLTVTQCSPEPALDEFVHVDKNIYVQRAAIEAARGELAPALTFIVRISSEPVDFYAVDARIQCAAKRMRIDRSTHYKNRVQLSSGAPRKVVWYRITEGTPAASLRKTVCNPPETV